MSRPTSSTPDSSGKSLFWAFQSAGWSLFFLIIVGVNLYNDPNEWSVILLAFLVTALGFGSTSLFRTYIKQREWVKRRPKKLILPILVGSVLTGLTWAGTFIGIHLALADVIGGTPPNYTVSNMLLTLVNNYFIVLLWSLIYFAYHYFRMAQVARIERYRSEAAMRDAQLNTLKGQINPHFMFNSLNNIRALMLEDVARSREMLTRLSDLLRYSMSISNQRVVSLREEIAIVHDFLELCKIQYENRLSYEVQVDANAHDVQIPPMIIQILVENSVKHGIANTPNGGEVKVDVKRDEEHLIIEVSNTGEWVPGRNRADSTGIGLPNIRKRLQIIYGDNATLHLREEAPLIVARITLPL